MKHVLILLMLLLPLVAVGQDKPRGATLAQQKMCAEQARKIFHEDNPVRPEHALTWEYSSHYEVRTNVCYIMTWTTLVENHGFSISHGVYDAFEGREYASALETTDHGRETMDECTLTPPNHDPISCKTMDEFLRLVEQH